MLVINILFIIIIDLNSQIWEFYEILTAYT